MMKQPVSYFLILFLAWTGIIEAQGVFEVKIRDRDASPPVPGQLPEDAGYLFEAVCTLNTNILPPDRYRLDWSADGGRFDARYPGLYLSPSQATQPKYKVTATATLYLASALKIATDSVEFEVVPARFKGNGNLAGQPFPHLSKMRVNPSAYAAGVDDIPSYLAHLTKYGTLTVDGDELPYLDILRNSNGYQKVCLRFTQSGSEIAAMTFALGLDKSYDQGGKPFSKQPWPGFWLYRMGARLSENLPGDPNALQLTLQGDVGNQFIIHPKVDPTHGEDVGDYVVIFDRVNGQDQIPSTGEMELAEIGAIACNADGNTVLTLKSRGTVKMKGRNVLLGVNMNNIPERFFKVSSHPAGSLVRPLAVAHGFPDGFRINSASPFRNPGGLTVHEWLTLYLLRELNRDFASDTPYSGMIYDGWKFDVTTYWIQEVVSLSDLLDSDLDNEADFSEPGDRPESLRNHFGESRLQFWRLLRELAGTGRMIIGDNHSNQGYGILNGTEFEGFPCFNQGTLDADLPFYRERYMSQTWSYRNNWCLPTLAGSDPYTELFTKRTNAIFYNNHHRDPMYQRTPSNNLFRLDLGTTLLEDTGYYLYSPHPDAYAGILDGWMDEFDGGLGSSLQNGIQLGTNWDKNFFINVFERPDQPGLCPFQENDLLLVGPEKMTVKALANIATGVDDTTGARYYTIPVARDANRLHRTRQGAGTKVMKLSELPLAGSGYLGQPRGPARHFPQVQGDNLLPDSGSCDAAGDWISGVVALSPQEYTFQFQANSRERTRMSIQVLVIEKKSFVRSGKNARKTVARISFEATQEIGDFACGFVPSAAEEYVLVVQSFRGQESFALAQPILQAGGYHVYRRDFEHGIVLVNGTNAPVSFDLRDDLYRHLAGTQDPAVNNGLPVTSPEYSLGPLDARILLRRELDLSGLTISPAPVSLGNGESVEFVLSQDLPALWSLSVPTAGEIEGPFALVSKVAFRAGSIPGTYVLTARFREVSVTAEITVRDTLAPVITIHSPATGDLEPSANVTVIGTVEDADPQIEYRLGHGQGTDAFTWLPWQLGQVIQGALQPGLSNLADGRHRFRVQARDGSGNLALSAPTFFSVDTTAPLIKIFSPVSGDVIPDTTLLVKATVRGTHFQDYRLGIGQGSEPLSWQPWQPGQVTYGDLQPGISGLADGRYRFRVEARNKAGNVAASPPVSFAVDTQAPLVRIFSPSQGAALPSANVVVKGTVRGTHFDQYRVGVGPKGDALSWQPWQQGQVIYSSLQPVLVLPGEGDYKLRVQAMDRAGNLTDSELIFFSIDTTAPLIKIFSPVSGDVLPDPGLVVKATVRDPHFQHYHLGIGQGPEPISGESWQPWQPGQVIFGNLPPAITGLADGHYRFRVRARDRAGNVTISDPIYFRIDTTAPVVKVFSPVSGAVLPSANVVVKGTVRGPNFDQYRLGVGPKGGALVWHPWQQGRVIYSSLQPTLSLPGEGDYKLRVQAVDRAGNLTESDPVFFSIDTTAPEIEIASPAPGDVISDTSVKVHGRAWDPNFRDYRLGYARGTDPLTYLPWQEVPVRNGVLQPVLADLLNGRYRIRLEARDEAGNVSPAATSCFVVAPPSP